MAQKYLTAFDYVDLHANLILQKHARVSELQKLSLHMTKPINWPVCPAKTQISLGICPVWSVFAVHSKDTKVHAHSENSDQTGWTLRLIWVFAGCTGHFVGLSCCSSNQTKALRALQTEMHIQGRLRSACASVQSGQTSLWACHSSLLYIAGSHFTTHT